jgi:pyrimidine-specific ribonucleoside hydrolase
MNTFSPISPIRRDVAHNVSTKDTSFKIKILPLRFQNFSHRFTKKMYKKIFLGVCVLFLSLSVTAHSGKSRFHIIIDTDGAADDLRAICMLLSNREVETLAITTSEGALTSDLAAVKVTSLLHEFRHEGIPVAAGRSLNISPPFWRQQSENIVWASKQAVPIAMTAVELIIETIELTDDDIIFFALGTLTNLSDALAAKPSIREKIDRVIWYNSSAAPLSGANYYADRISAYNVLASGIEIEIVSGSCNQEVIVDKDFLDKIEKVGNIYSNKIVQTHRSGALQAAIETSHLKMWDDLAVVFLFAPQLFTQCEGNTVFSLSDVDAAMAAKDVVIEILRGKPDTESRVFFGFPDDPSLYAADVAPVVKNIIARHGRSEWRAGVLTNELHGHLGIYAIVGVKMGIRAREFFNIGVDDIFVVTYAGMRPPISCINDGLQVSTGGTIGHGLMRVSDEEYIRAEATFTFKNRTLRMKLKDEYSQQIRTDVMQAIQEYGNLTEPYWERIRVLAIKYWEEFDRHDMFDMTYSVSRNVHE